MKDKHIHSPPDSELLRLIQCRVRQELSLHEPTFYGLLWTKFVVYASAIVLAYAGLYELESSFMFVLCYMLYGFVLVLLAFNFAHDLSHSTVFSSKKLNNLGFILIFSMAGAHAEAWKQRHLHSHHYAPNVKGYDSDLEISTLIRVIPDSPYCWYHRFQPVYAPLAYTSYSLFWIFIKDFVILFSKDEFTQRKDVGYHLSFWLQKSVYLLYLLVFPLLFSLQPWYVVVAGFLLMHLSQSLFLLFTFFITHHVETTSYPTIDAQGYIRTSWLRNQVESSNDMHPFSPVANFLLGGFNNHVAHHLFPHIHHIHYPRLNRLLYPMLVENGIRPNYTTYLGGIKSHLRLLKRMSYA